VSSVKRVVLLSVPAIVSVLGVKSACLVRRQKRTSYPKGLE